MAKTIIIKTHIIIMQMHPPIPPYCLVDVFRYFSRLGKGSDEEVLGAGVRGAGAGGEGLFIVVVPFPPTVVDAGVLPP